MRNSASNITSSTVPVPTCDAWGHLMPDSTVGYGAGFGWQNGSRESAGLWRFNFFSQVSSGLGGGGYVVLYTPEVRSTPTCALSSQRTESPPAVLGSTTAGSTSRFSISTWRMNSFSTVPSKVDFAANTLWINFAVFSLSRDNQLRVPAGGTYALVPGASAYGISGATYYSTPTSALSERSATAYGTVVLPPSRSNASAFSTYVEGEFNIDRVEPVGGGPEYDVYFRKPMGTTLYCVILCAESETFDLPSWTGIPSINEYSHPIVIRGDSDEHKTVSKFRIRHIKQNSSDNSWTSGNFASMQSGLTERIHFMVFGGGTYGQP